MSALVVDGRLYAIGGNDGRFGSLLRATFDHLALTAVVDHGPSLEIDRCEARARADTDSEGEGVCLGEREPDVVCERDRG